MDDEPTPDGPAVPPHPTPDGPAAAAHDDDPTPDGPAVAAHDGDTPLACVCLVGGLA